MTDKAKASEDAKIHRAQAIQASVDSLLFQTLDLFRGDDETASDAAKMAAADDLMGRVMQAIATHFDAGKANYALARYVARSQRDDRAHLHTGSAIRPKPTLVAETPAEMVMRRQGRD